MDAEITPFRVAFPPAAIDDLRRRIAAARLPEAMPGSGSTYGMDYDRLRDLLAYWGGDYDWDRAQAELNRFDHFRTRIDDLSIHFVHIRSPHAAATPVLMIHGWPGSFVEFIDVADRLTRPENHGADPATAVHLVLPSLPGFGLSEQPRVTGWCPERTARAFNELMRRLGYARYGVQGGDFGAIVLGEMGLQDNGALIGLHTNMPMADAPPGEDFATDTTRMPNSERAYAMIQATKPHTLGVALNDSPAGLCAWIGEKFHTWTDRRGDEFSPVDRDRLLTNITLYWLTGTAHSAARYYHEYFKATPFTRKGRINVPTAVARFPKEMVKPPRAWVERHYNIVRWSEFDRGGHFAALEVPDLFATDVRTFFHEIKAG